MELLMPASVHAAQGWIQYAFQHGVKSFVLDLCLPPERDDDEEEEEDDRSDRIRRALHRCIMMKSTVVFGIEKSDTMYLALGGASLRLPTTTTTTTMKFASLVDLSLERIEIAAGGGARLLAHLVSPVR